MRANHPLARALVFYGTRLKHRGQERVHSWIRSRFGVTIDEELDVRRRDVRWTLNPADSVQRDLYWYGEYDRWDFYHLTRFASRGSTVLDVGSNYGYYAIKLAVTLERNVRVHAFEPFPATFKRLLRHIAMNRLEGVVVPHEVALSDRMGRQQIHTWSGVDRNSGATTLAHGIDSRGVVLNDGGSVSVTTLDAFMQSQRIEQLSVIKIDVEGLEESVLRGGEQTIEKHQPIVMLELHTRMLGRAGSTPERVVGWLQKRGYTMYQARQSKLMPLTALPRDGEFVNAFALPRGRIAN